MSLPLRRWLAGCLDVALTLGASVCCMVVIDLFYDLLRYPVFFYCEEFPGVYFDLAEQLPLAHWGLSDSLYLWSLLVFMAIWQVLWSSVWIWKAASPGMAALGLWLRAPKGGPVCGRVRMGRWLLHNLAGLIFVVPLAPVSLKVSLLLMMIGWAGALPALVGQPTLLDLCTGTRVLARTQEVEL